MLPDMDESGSARLYHSFRLIHGMHKKWEAMRDGDEDITLDPKKSVEDRYLVPVKPKKPKGAGGGKHGKGHDAP